MITRVYINNFKCFVNFEYKPQAFQLLTGSNGSGKSSLFEVFERFRMLVAWGAPVGQAFPTYELTAWQTIPQQAFERDILGLGGVFTYRLHVGHNLAEAKSSIELEELFFDGNVLYRFDGNEAHQFSDDSLAGPVYPFEPTRSAISTIPARGDNQKLTWFRNRLWRTFIFSLNPWKMLGQSERDNFFPDRDLANLASWYRHLTQQSPELMGPLFESLREVLPGFSTLRLISAGEANRYMQVVFQPDEMTQQNVMPFGLSLEQLSEGQRCLVALYVILHGLVQNDTTICLDEPDNFIALREIQPWLLELQDEAENAGCQCLLISHHPEFIDQLDQQAVEFHREGAGPVRIDSLVQQANEVEQGELDTSEMMARGWKA